MNPTPTGSYRLISNYLCPTSLQGSLIISVSRGIANNCQTFQKPIAMKYLFLLFFSAFFCFAKYTFCQPTPPPSCQIPVGLMLDTLINLSIEQYAPGLSQEEKDKRIGSYTLGKLERFRAAMEEEPLDSLFRFSRQYLSERMGEEIFCRRVRLWPSSFNYWRGQVDFVFHFYFKEDFEKKRTRSQIKLRFKKQKIGTYEFSPPDNVPACAERPEECEFNFLSLVEALERVQKAGLLDIASPYRIESGAECLQNSHTYSRRRRL